MRFKYENNFFDIVGNMEMARMYAQEFTFARVDYTSRKGGDTERLFGKTPMYRYDRSTCEAINGRCQCNSSLASFLYRNATGLTDPDPAGFC